MQLIAWPLSPSDEWRKGFLAGIFDAEGSCGGQALRIANTDRLILDWTTACLAHFGFSLVEEATGKANGLCCVRLRGGLRERLRFFHLTDPAITRKRTVQGMALKSDAKTRVASIEPLGLAMRLYDITTGTGDFIANGVVSHNCFARPTHTYLDFNAGRDFEKEIVVKVNVPEVLRVELARPSWKGEHVAMGTNTDPYQWVEGRYKLMRGIWEAFRDAANPCSVLTKSPLLLRDLDLMKEIAAVTDISANLSVPDDRREGVAGERAAHAQSAGAARGRGRAQPGGHPDRHPGGAADAGDQRRPRPGARRSCRRRRTRGRPGSAASGCICAARCAASSWSGCAPIGRTSSSATRSSMHAARTCHG